MWNHSERSSSFYSNNHQTNSSLLNSKTAYTRLKRLTERLLELERKARETIFEKKCDQQILTNSIQKRRLSTKNNEQSFSNDQKEQENKKEFFRIPIIHSLKTK